MKQSADAYHVGVALIVPQRNDSARSAPREQPRQLFMSRRRTRCYSLTVTVDGVHVVVKRHYFHIFLSPSIFRFARYADA